MLGIELVALTAYPSTGKLYVVSGANLFDPAIARRQQHAHIQPRVRIVDDRNSSPQVDASHGSANARNVVVIGLISVVVVLRTVIAEGQSEREGIVIRIRIAVSIVMTAGVVMTPAVVMTTATAVVMTAATMVTATAVTTTAMVAPAARPPVVTRFRKCGRSKENK